MNQGLFKILFANVTFYFCAFVFITTALSASGQTGAIIDDCYTATGVNLTRTVNVSGFSVKASLVQHQWQVLEIGSTNWVNTGASGATYTVTVTAPKYYRLKSYVGLLGDPTEEAYSNVVYLDKPMIGAVENRYFENQGNGIIGLQFYEGSVVQWEMKQGTGAWVNKGLVGQTQFPVDTITRTTQLRVLLQDCGTNHYSRVGEVTIQNKNFSGYVSGTNQVYTGGDAALTLSNYRGSIIRWEKLVGATTSIISTTSAALNQTGITSITHYRAVVSWQGVTEYSPWWRVSVVSDNPSVDIIENNYTAVDMPVSSVSLITDESNSVRTISFEDGLGRPVQTVVKAATSASSKDLVTFVDYDANGQVTRGYLPYAATSTGWSEAQTNVQNAQASFYNGSTPGVSANIQPWTDVKLDDSPMAFTEKIGAPGSVWDVNGARAQELAHLFNSSSDAVKLWNTDGTSTTTYAAGTLTKTIVTDENDNRVIVFTDKNGLEVCRKVEHSLNNYLVTYNVYDDYGRIRYIIPPNATAISSNLTYEFKYDTKGRLIEKSVPGGGWEYIVYDKKDRPVLTQNAVQRASNQWMFVKYDFQGRPVYNGIFSSTSTRSSLQTSADGTTVKTAEKRQSNATYHGYSNIAFPTSGLTVHQVYYYDDYDFDRNGSPDYAFTTNDLTGQVTTTIASTNKLPTGSKTRILDGGSNFLVSVVFYDSKGRPVQVKSNNHTQLSVSDISTSIYNDWTGTINKLKTTTKIGNNTYIVTSRYLYDRQNRVTQVFQQNASDTEVEVAAYTYNDLGQLITKKLHKSGADYLQQLDFQYNERGWIKQVNDPAVLTDPKKFFAFKLNYNTTTSGVTGAASYNGNIAGMEWSQYGGRREAYGFTYDKADRMTASDYGEGNGYTAKADGYNETTSWDTNGNMTGLTRKEWTSGTTNATIDNLTTVYSGNQLTRVNDAGDANKGYPNASNADNEMVYNTAGYLTKDLNKNITSITYNHLNKPLVITTGDGKTINYTYAADGSKLKRELKDGATVLETVKYVSNYYVLNDVVKHFSSSEGRTVVKSTSNTGAENQYYLTDHLGNIRTVFTSAAPQVWNGVTATMETENATNEDNYWFNITRMVNSTANTTSGGNEVQTLDAAHRSGAGTVLEVFPGDQVNISVKSYYTTSGSVTNTAAVVLADIASAIFTGAGGFAGEGFSAGSISMGYGAGTALAGKSDSGQPKAYLNYLFYDRNFNYVTAGFKQVEGSGSRTLALSTVTFDQPGYVFVYLTYESTSGYPVSFDDFTYTHTTTRVLASNAYYPFGMLSGQSWVRPENPLNRNLYNAGNERNETTGYDETFYRLYDPALGRFMGVDPLAAVYGNKSPYHYANNNPLKYNDPMGDDYYYDGEGWVFFEGLESNTPDGGSTYGRFRSQRTMYGPPSYGGMTIGSGGHWADNLLSAHPDADYYALKDYYNRFSDTFDKWGFNWVDGKGLGYYKREPYQLSGEDEWSSELTGAGEDFATLGYRFREFTHHYTFVAFSQEKNQSSEGGDCPTCGADDNSSSGMNWLNLAAAETTIWGAGTSIAVNGPKPKYTGPGDWSRQVKAGTKFGNRLGYLGLALTATDMAMNGVNTSNSLDATFGVVSFMGVPGAIIGGVYFGANLITEGITGKTIGQHVDDNYYIIPVGTPNMPFMFIPKN